MRFLLVLTVLLLPVALCTRVPLLVLNAGSEPVRLEETGSFSDLLDKFLTTGEKHLVYVQYGVDTESFMAKMKPALANSLSALPYDIDTTIDAKAPIVQSLRASLMNHEYSIVDTEDILKVRQHANMGLRDMLVVNGKSTEASINEGLERVRKAYTEEATSILYVGLASSHKLLQKNTFKAVEHKNIPPSSHDTDIRAHAEKTNENILRDDNRPIAEYDRNGNLLMPVWAHSFMTPQWLQVWIMVILLAGLIMWGLIVSLKIPVPTNIPEPLEQV